MESVRRLGVLAGVWVSAWALTAAAQGDPAGAPAAPPTPTAPAPTAPAPPAPAAPAGSAPDQQPPAPAPTAAAPAPAPAPAPSYPAPVYQAPAYGQQPYGPPGYPAPGYYGYPPRPPPPPPPDDTVERHDGLYLSFGLGFGYFKNSIDYGGGPIGNSKVSKGAVSFEFLLGGTPAPGLVIGGGLLATAISEPNVEVDGQTDKNNDLTNMSVASFGPFVDFYPDDKGGFHVQAFVGYSQLTFETDTDGQSKSSEQPEGYGLAGAVGYDFWVGEQWSIGVLGRLMYANMAVTVNDIDQTHHVLSPTLGVRGLLH